MRVAGGAIGLIVLGLAASNAGAATISVSQVLQGQLLLSEIMPNPAGNDNLQEWFEVYNPLPVAVDLNGMIVASNNGQFTVGSGHILGANALATFARSSDPALNGNLPAVEFAWGQALSLTNTNGQLALLNPNGTSIVSATWTQALSGQSLQLTSGTAPQFGPSDFLITPVGGPSYDPAIYMQPPATPPNMGTPGATNDAPILVTGTNMLLISEFLADPAGINNSEREWFEVLNPNATPFNLKGVTVTVGSNSFTVAGDHIIPGGGIFVFASSDDPAINGGLPHVDYAWGNAVVLPNINGELSLTDPDGNLIVSTTWTNVTDGASKRLRSGVGPTFDASNYDDSEASYSPPAPLPGDPTFTNYGTPNSLATEFFVTGIPPFDPEVAIDEPPALAILVLTAAGILGFGRRRSTKN